EERLKRSRCRVVMSITYKIDGNRRIVFTAMAGALSFRQLVAQAVALQSDPRFHSSFCELVDVRGVTESDLSFREMVELAQTIDPFSPAARRAIVAGSELMYGTSRMYQSILDDERTSRSSGLWKKRESGWTSHRIRTLRTARARNLCLHTQREIRRVKRTLLICSRWFQNGIQDRCLILRDSHVG